MHAVGFVHILMAALVASCCRLLDDKPLLQLTDAIKLIPVYSKPEIALYISKIRL